MRHTPLTPNPLSPTGRFRVNAQKLFINKSLCGVYKIVAYMISYGPPWTTEERDVAGFLFKTIELATRAKKYLDQLAAFKLVLDQKYTKY